MIRKHPTWDNVLKLSLTDPIVASVLKAVPSAPREEQLIWMVLHLSADRLARIAHEVETKEMEFLNSLGQIKC